MARKSSFFLPVALFFLCLGVFLGAKHVQEEGLGNGWIWRCSKADIPKGSGTSKRIFDRASQGVNPAHQNPQVAPPLPIIDLSSTFISDAIRSQNQSTLANRRISRYNHDVESLSKRDGEKCGIGSPCPDASCCSKDGICGYGPTYCGKGNCTSNCDALAMCGRYSDLGGTISCGMNICCSFYGWCGTQEAHCGDLDPNHLTPCQAGFGLCKIIPPPSCGKGSGSTNGRSIGYYQASNVRERLCNRISPSQIDLKGYTHLYFAFAEIDAGYNVIPSEDADIPLYTDFTALKSSSLETWIAIGGFDFSGPTKTIWSDLVSSSAGRATFIASLKAFMAKYGFQGADIDWEYPGSSERGGKRADTENFVALVQEMRASFGTSYGISVTLAPDYWYLRWFDARAMEPYVDWFGFMAYDLHGFWDADLKTLGALVRGQTDIREIYNDTMPLWFDGLDPSKINMGLALYGRGYTLSNPSCNQLLCPFSGPSKPGPCTNFDGVMSLIEIENVIKQHSLVPELIDGAMMKQITWDDQWIGYDDLETIALKKAWADSLCFGGTMLWSVDFNSGVGSGTTPSQTVTTDGTCGKSHNETICGNWPSGDCCSAAGYCGSGESYCGSGCQSGSCIEGGVTTDGTCGAAYRNTACGNWAAGACCSSAGYCGNSTDHCGVGCQSGCPTTDGTCGNAYDGKSCGDWPQGGCCSLDGFCGNSAAHCGTGCQSGPCSKVAPGSPTLDGSCGPNNGGTICGDWPQGGCCSSYGFCGNDTVHCGDGCLSGPCNAGSGVVNIDPNVWSGTQPQNLIECEPPCTFILPPYSLASPLTFTWPAITTSVLSSSNGQTLLKTTTITIPVLTTTLIEFWSITVVSGDPTSIIITAEQSIKPPFTTIVLPATELAMKPTNVPLTTTTTSTGPIALFWFPTPHTITFQPQPTVSIPIPPGPPPSTGPHDLTYTNHKPQPTCVADCGSQDCDFGCSGICGSFGCGCGPLGCGGACGIGGCGFGCGLLGCKGRCSILGCGGDCGLGLLGIHLGCGGGGGGGGGGGPPSGPPGGPPDDPSKCDSDKTVGTFCLINCPETVVPWTTVTGSCITSCQSSLSCGATDSSTTSSAIMTILYPSPVDGIEDPAYSENYGAAEATIFYSSMQAREEIEDALATATVTVTITPAPEPTLCSFGSDPDSGNDGFCNCDNFVGTLPTLVSITTPYYPCGYTSLPPNFPFTSTDSSGNIIACQSSTVDAGSTGCTGETSTIFTSNPFPFTYTDSGGDIIACATSAVDDTSTSCSGSVSTVFTAPASTPAPKPFGWVIQVFSDDSCQNYVATYTFSQVYEKCTAIGQKIYSYHVYGTDPNGNCGSETAHSETYLLGKNGCAGQQSVGGGCTDNGCEKPLGEQFDDITYADHIIATPNVVLEGTPP